MKLNLRNKGSLALVLLAGWILLFGWYQWQDRIDHFEVFSEVQRIGQREALLDRTAYVILHSVLRIEHSMRAKAFDSSFARNAGFDLDLIGASLRELDLTDAQIVGEVAGMNQAVERLRSEPSTEAMRALADAGQVLSERLKARWQETQQLRRQRWDTYRAKHDRNSVVSFGFGVLGVLLFGALMARFLHRLTQDVRQVSVRALEVVTGFRGKPLLVTRHDEVGDLMSAINGMQVELRRREQQLEISRQQFCHSEKMAAVGSLAAAVAHEINNPIAALAGIAEAMREGDQADPGAASGHREAFSELILTETRRITMISRQIAEQTAPHSREPELLDLNRLVRGTCSFVGYDRRFRDINLTLDLDHDVQAVLAIGDHVTQVLMNLLINSADALGSVAGRKPLIQVVTRSDPDGVRLEVRDNGCGMDAQVLARAFEENFSTKPAPLGRGLGLFLCKALIEQFGGRISLASTEDVGTTASIWIPAQVLQPA